MSTAKNPFLRGGQAPAHRKELQEVLSLDPSPKGSHGTGEHGERGRALEGSTEVAKQGLSLCCRGKHRWVLTPLPEPWCYGLSGLKCHKSH